MALPLSARINPYFFIAFRMAWFAGENVETSKLDFSRNLIPIGIGDVLFVPAQWVAGLTNADVVLGTVKRIACLIDPAATSS